MKNSKATITKYVVLTIIAGILFWLIGEVLISKLFKAVFNPLAMTIYFCIFFLILAAFLWFLIFNKSDMSDKENKKDKKDLFKTALVFFLIFLLVVFLFEFLYELGKNKVSDPTSLIFLVDDSGSMVNTEQERLDAIDDVMNKGFPQLPYAVYVFADSASLVRKMAPKGSDTTNGLVLGLGGGTDILNSIEQVLYDYDNGVLVGAGDSPKIILLSDGYSSNWGMGGVARDCVERQMTVSSVGIGANDSGYLKRIARKTGGVYVDSNGASSLSQTMAEAVQNDTNRHLLSDRAMFKNDGLYAFLRILFLSIMGVIWSYLKYLLCDDDADHAKKTFVISLTLCTISSVLLEVLFSFGVSGAVLRLAFCSLWALTIGNTYPVGQFRQVMGTDMASDPSEHSGAGTGNQSEIGDRIEVDEKGDHVLNDLLKKTDSGEENDYSGLIDDADQENQNASEEKDYSELFDKQDTDN